MKSASSYKDRAIGGRGPCNCRRLGLSSSCLVSGQFNQLLIPIQLVTDFASISVERRTDGDEMTDRDDSETERKGG